MEQGSVVHRSLTFKFLEEITDDFSNERKLGRGSYGIVYKGECKDGEMIAVKVLRDILGLDDEQFEKEYLNIASLKHKNIVRVVGYCHETRKECVPYNGRFVFAENTKRALCFEYMHNGSLDSYLSDESSGHDWQTRYQIIRGICEGLKYLHEDLGSPMYHLDLKPANVLLDQDFVPKIADFGLSRLIEGEQTQLTGSAIGTLGYQPPEYIDGGIVSIKFDIYSLGVVIIKIMTGPMGYFRTAEMSPKEFKELVLANWKNRLLAASENMLESSFEQVKRCIEIGLSCVEGNRRKRPCIGVIINKLIETEGMIGISGALRKDTGSSMDQVCDSGSEFELNYHNIHVVDRLPFHENFAAVSRAHLVSLFNSNARRLDDVPENPWILRADTERFSDPCELTNESTRIWVMKLKTTTKLVCLSEQELNDQNWELCEEVKERCLEQLFEVACSFTDARWSVSQISHQVMIFDALVDVLFSIWDLWFNRSGEDEVVGIINKMVNAFNGVIMRTSTDIHSSEESTINPATVVLIEALQFFSRNREMVQSIFESGDYNIDPYSDMIDCWICKLKQGADIFFQEKGQRYIFIMNNTYYVLQRVCYPGLLLPDVVSNLRSLIDQYTVSYLDECWRPPTMAHHSSLHKFTEEFYKVSDCQMTLRVHHELKYILRKEIAKLVVPEYVNFLEASQANQSVSRPSWLKGMWQGSWLKGMWQGSWLKGMWQGSEKQKLMLTNADLECVIRELFEG